MEMFLHIGCWSLQGPWKSILAELELVDHFLMLLKSETHVHFKNHVADLLSKLCWIQVITPGSGPTSDEKSRFPLMSPEETRQCAFDTENLQSFVLCALDTVNLQSFIGILHHIVDVIYSLRMDQNLWSLSYVMKAEESNKAVCSYQSGLTSPLERSNWLTRALREDQPLLPQGVVKLLARQIMKRFSDRLHSPRSVLFALDALASNIHLQEELLLQDVGRLVSRIVLASIGPRLPVPPDFVVDPERHPRVLEEFN